MKIHLEAVLFVLALVPTTCLAASSDPEDDASSFVAAELNGLGLTIATSGCEAPSSISTRTVSNKYVPTVMDEVQTTSCPGFEAVTYIARGTDGGRSIPIQLTVIGPHPKLPEYLSVGASDTAVRARLGKPWYDNGQSFSYGLDESESTVTFTSSEGRITSIVWAWYSE
jgi:hypothetical protein